MRRPKILVVDDEVEFVQTLVERLQIRGIDAQGVTSGAEAIGYLEAEHFDVVVADLKMPVMDGEAIRRRVKALHPDTAVLLVTGHGGRDDDSEDAEDYLQKPFGIETLISRITATVSDSEDEHGR